MLFNKVDVSEGKLVQLDRGFSGAKLYRFNQPQAEPSFIASISRKLSQALSLQSATS
jgi:hypothetical protein